MNKPCILQRFDLKGKSLLLIEGETFQMEKCDAFGYLVFTPDANKKELIQRMKNALKEQYGRQMEVIVAEERCIDAGETFPEATMNEIHKCNPLPFSIKYVPETKDEGLYPYFPGKLIPILSMELFVPAEHKKYFDARSVYLDYRNISQTNEWDVIENEVAELHGQCIPTEKWLPRENGN